MMSRQFEFHTPRVVAALVFREMSTTYGKSVGGYLWAFLEPIGGIVVLTLAFSLAMRSPPIGNSFAFFYATGILAFGAYNSTQGKVAGSITFSKGLLSYPRVTFFDAAVARFLLNALTQLIVAFCIFAGLFVVTDMPMMVDVAEAVTAFGLALWLGFGVGVLNSFLFNMVPVWKNIWSIVTRPLFLASGLFFLMESLPPAAQKILWFNPLIHITAMMRDAFYPTYHPSYLSVDYVIWCSAIPTVLGLFLLRRYHKMILNEL